MAGTKMVSPGSKITSMTFTPGRLDPLMSFNGRKIPSMLGKGHDIFRRNGEGQWGTGHKWSVYSLYRHTSRKRRICFSKNSRGKAEQGLYLHQIAMGTAGVLKGATQKARLIVIEQCICSKVPQLRRFQELTSETYGNQPCLLFPILTRKRSVSLLKSAGISQGAKRVKRFRPEICVSHAWVKDGSMCKGVIAPAAPIKSQWKSSGMASGWENME